MIGQRQTPHLRNLLQIWKAVKDILLIAQNVEREKSSQILQKYSHQKQYESLLFHVLDESHGSEKCIIYRNKSIIISAENISMF